MLRQEQTDEILRQQIDGILQKEHRRTSDLRADVRHESLRSTVSMGSGSEIDGQYEKFLDDFPMHGEGSLRSLSRERVDGFMK
jgi:hypothetical protein